MIVAAEAIPDNLTAEKLHVKSRDVITGLKCHGVNIVSYACDGTQVERSAQDLIIAHATGHLSYMIPDPEDDQKHEIRIPIVRATLPLTLLVS